MFFNVLDHLNQETLFHSSQRLLDILILHNLPRSVLGNLTSNYLFPYINKIIFVIAVLLLYC